jgi:hypothetical protein
MAAIAEIPIITPRTLELLGDDLSPEKSRLLRERLEGIKPLFESFLCEDQGETAEAYVMATSKYLNPRLEFVILLLSLVRPAGLSRMLELIADLASDLLQEQGWRLGNGVRPLWNAWGTYARTAKLLTEHLTEFSPEKSLPYGLLMTSTRMDFSLTATAMYLEGEFPRTNATRLEYLCRAAESETAAVEGILRQALSPLMTTAQKAESLRRLFGSWKGDDRVDEDLKDLYESRLYNRPDLS